MLSKKHLLVTTGDPDGIGFEVSAKALVCLPISFFKATSIYLFVSETPDKRYVALLKKAFSIVLQKTNSALFKLDAQYVHSKSKKPILHLIVADDSPADWIYNLAKICLKNPTTTALVTGPLSKTLIQAAGYKAIGHTEILSEVSKVDSLYMGFVGKYFNVLLMTGHVPLQQVSSQLKKLNLKKLFEIALQFSKSLPNADKPIGLVALNPHAGEKGLISEGEDGYLNDQIQSLAMKQIQGPLVPDAAFLKANWERYSLYLCCYHDQGLIPFKAIHGQDSGVHVTLGLPFVRTSVDHGTAKEIFRQNKANPNSMKEALALAKRLLS